MSDNKTNDITPELIDVIEVQVADHIKDSRNEFKVAVIREDKFHATVTCPHCGSTKLPDYIANFSEDDGKYMGDITHCSDCENIIILLRFPVLGYPFKVFLNWTLK